MSTERVGLPEGEPHSKPGDLSASSVVKHWHFFKKQISTTPKYFSQSAVVTS